MNRVLLLVFILIVLPGCAPFLLLGISSVNCIDSKIPRRTTQIDPPFNVEVEFKDRIMSKILQCEEYYDAQCSARGNSWSYREVGLGSRGERSKLQFVDSELGNIVIPLPKCEDLAKGREIPLEWVAPEFDGRDYLLVSPEDNIRTFEACDPTKVNPSQKTIKISYAVKVNDVPLKDCYERMLKPLKAPQAFNVEFEFKDKKMSMLMSCGEYYKPYSECDVSIRRFDAEGAFQFTDSELGRVKVWPPDCSDLVDGKELSLDETLVITDKGSYHLVSSEGNMRTFELDAPLSGCSLPNTIKVNYSLKVNGVPLK